MTGRAILVIGGVTLGGAVQANAALLVGEGQSLSAFTAYGLRTPDKATTPVGAGWVAGPSDGTGTQDADFNHMWLSNGDYPTVVSPVWFYLDLHQIQKLNQVTVWNYNESGLQSRGVSTANIYVGNTLDGLHEQIPGQVFNEATGASGYSAPTTTINLAGIQTRYVGFQITSNFGSPGDPYVGLSKVMAYGNSPPVGNTFPAAATAYTVANSTASSFFNPRSPANAANGAALTATTGRDYNAGYALTGNENTQWLTDNSTPHQGWIQFDLGSSKALGEMEVTTLKVDFKTAVILTRVRQRMLP